MKILRLFYLATILSVCYSYAQVPGIVGGKDTDIKEVPWQVSIHHKGRHICGGVIISEDYILTAGHCIVDTNPNHFY